MDVEGGRLLDDGGREGAEWDNPLTEGCLVSKLHSLARFVAAAMIDCTYWLGAGHGGGGAFTFLMIHHASPRQGRSRYVRGSSRNGERQPYVSMPRAGVSSGKGCLLARTSGKVGSKPAIFFLKNYRNRKIKIKNSANI